MTRALPPALLPAAWPATPRRATSLAALLAVALLLAGCGGPAGIGAGEAGDPPTGDWVLIDGSGPGGPLALVDSHPVTLSIDGTDWGGTAACNHYGGTVSVDGDRLTVGDLFRTEMACLDDGVMELESAYLDALGQVTGFEVADDRLRLTGEGVELVYEVVPPEPDAALAGTTWRLESLVLGGGPDGAVSSTMAEATLHLDDAGTLTAEPGCNHVTARYTLDGDRLTITDLVTTDIACEPGVAEQEAHVLGVLGAGEVTVTIEGSRLVLTAPDGRGLDLRVQG